MIVQAVFIGKDNSLGYRNNRVYKIHISRNTIMCYNLPNNGICPYGSVEAFLKNWRLI